MECGLTDDRHQLSAPNKKTNPKSAKVFLIFMLLYVGIVLYAIIIGGSAELKGDASDYIKLLHDFLPVSRFVIFIICFVGLLSAALCVVIVHQITKALIIIGFVIEFLTFFSNIFKIFSEPQTNLSWIPIGINICSFWALCVTLFALSRVGTNLISQVIKESCRAIKDCSFVIVISVLTTVMVCIVTVLTLVAEIYLLVLFKANETSYLLCFCMIINLIGGFWLVCFIICFTGLVFSKVFSLWFYTEDKLSMSKSTTMKSIAITSSYHLGTVAYASSLIFFFPIIYILIKNILKKERDTRYSIFVLLPCYFSISLVLGSNSYIETATKGKSYKKSLDASSQIYLKYPLQMQALYKSLILCVAIASILIIGVYFLIVYGIVGKSLFHENRLVLIVLLFLAFIGTVTPGTLLIAMAATTIVYCLFDNYECEKQNKIKTSYINPKLEDLVLKE